MENCPVKYALDVLSGKWKLYIMFVLSKQEELRFNELQRQVGSISATMLSKNLAELEAARLIIRHEYHEIPPHVAYSLTAMGRELTPALQSLGEWGHRLYLKNEGKVENG